jgi:hypothetical protein
MHNENTSVHGNEKQNINRDEVCRRRCRTAAEREAAIDKILGLSTRERGQALPEKAPPPNVDPGLTEVLARFDRGLTKSKPVKPGQS